MQRRIGVLGASAINIITMIGIGPLVTVPLVLSALSGSTALLAWAAGALVALCDGMVWAELGSRFPGSGGTYTFLRESFGATSWGRGLAFLFTWQMLLFAPALLASGAIGAVQYAAFLIPGLAQGTLEKGILAAILAVLMTLGLLSSIEVAQKLSRIFAAIAILTLVVAISAGLLHPHWQNLTVLPHLSGTWTGIMFAFGTGLYIALYDYVGYAQVTLLGDELREPTRTTPRSIFWAIAVVAVLYILLQVSVLVTPITGDPQFFAATAVAHGFGNPAAAVFVVLVIITAFASLYGNLLGFARIPYAAARDGNFFRGFAALGRTTEIPYRAVIAIGIATIPLCFFSLDLVIAILTAGIVLIQAIAQIIAVIRLRMTTVAPFRMPLYPWPAFIALAGWLLAFVSTGEIAMVIGVGWLCLGALAFVFFAHRQRLWPFVVAASLLFLFLSNRPPAIAATQNWSGSAIQQEHGYPIFTVDGKPFFVWGAAFFYERIPSEEWEADLESYSLLGINTIDLYVPWNWHELRDGDFDFDGHTNSRRNLGALLKIIDAQGFKIILRPGPVIRNEWRNGGYPAWLLQRPEYEMPLHDILTGRYPATATLQNAHANAAGAQWLGNKTHLTYASRWLHRVLHEVAPYRRDVIAIALDDDQGAYIDNDTWPGPQWRAYIDWLKTTVQASVGTQIPLMINTYEQKVTAASPVWAWGDWYQSDAYLIGLHDLTQLDFATDLLATQPNKPTMIAEFQAGWLQGADEGKPRPSDPRNTTLALHELLQLGAHGIVNFPVQDTVNPDGWEAPWSNWSYAWDAANPQYGDSTGRYEPTRDFGQLIARLGATLATLHPVNDLAIVWTPSIYPSRSLTNSDFYASMRATLTALSRCRALDLSCRLIDLRYATNTDLFKQRSIVFAPDGAHTMLPRVAARLGALKAFGVRVYSTVDAAREHLNPILRGVPNARLLQSSSSNFAVIDISNPSNVSTRIATTVIHAHGTTYRIPALRVRPHGDRIVIFNIPLHKLAPYLHSNAYVKATDCAIWSEQSGTIENDRADLPTCDLLLTYPDQGTRLWQLRYNQTRELLAIGKDRRLHIRHRANIFARILKIHGDPGPVQTSITASTFNETSTIKIQNNNDLLKVSPKAGARSSEFGNAFNVASTIGLFRDAISPALPNSPRDYIAAYTHPMPAGTFNRKYHCAITDKPELHSLTCSYDAPDIPVGGARFTRTYTVAANRPGIHLDETFAPHDATSTAQLQSISGFRRDAGDISLFVPGANCVGVFYGSEKSLARLCWSPGDVAQATMRDTRGASLATLRFAKRHVTMTLEILTATTVEQARALVEEKTP